MLWQLTDKSLCHLVALCYRYNCPAVAWLPCLVLSVASACVTQMQQHELNQMRQRDANLTALAAIGPRKKRKVESPSSGAGAEVNSSSRPSFLPPSLSCVHLLSTFSTLCLTFLRPVPAPLPPHSRTSKTLSWNSKLRIDLITEFAFTIYYE